MAMHIFRTVDGYQDEWRRLRAQEKSIAFVPTLGALHAGHASLMALARTKADVVVASVFVNPTQFNESSDLEKYPRTLAADIEVLLAEEVDILFYPHDHEVYPEGLDTRVDIALGPVAEVMEGAERPGHFEGVMQVVNRLLDIVQPDIIVMGQKDLQQHTIIAHMLRALEKPTQLVVGPTMREASGLAMSSRNARLSPEGRVKAAEIYAHLETIKADFTGDNALALEERAMHVLTQDPFKAEYVQIVDAIDLQPWHNHKNPSPHAVVCCAVWLEGVRLIDNIPLD